MSSQSPTHVVVELLMTLFGSALEIRMFVRSLVTLARIDKELPDDAVSVEQMAHALVGRLTAHGALDDRLFAALATVRPLRAGEIRGVATSLAAPRVTGLMAVVKGVIPALRVARGISVFVAALTALALCVVFIAPTSEPELAPAPSSEPVQPEVKSEYGRPIRDQKKRDGRRPRPPLNNRAQQSEEVESAECLACKPWCSTVLIRHHTSYGGRSRREISISPKFSGEILPTVAGWRVTPSEVWIHGPTLDFKLLNRGHARFLTEFVLDLKLLRHTAEPLMFASMTADHPAMLRFYDLRAVPKGPCTLNADEVPALTVPTEPPRFHAAVPAWTTAFEFSWASVKGDAAAAPRSSDSVVYGTLTCQRSRADGAEPWVTRFIALTDQQTEAIRRVCDGRCGYGRPASVPKRFQHEPVRLGELVTAGSITIPIAHVLKTNEAEWFAVPLAVAQSGTYEVTYRILDQDGEVFLSGTLHADVIAPLNPAEVASGVLLAEDHLRDHGASLREKISQAWNDNCGEAPLVGRLELVLASAPESDELFGTIARVRRWTAGEPPQARPEQEIGCLEQAIVGHPVFGLAALEETIELSFGPSAAE